MTRKDDLEKAVKVLLHSHDHTERMAAVQIVMRDAEREAAIPPLCAICPTEHRYHAHPDSKLRLCAMHMAERALTLLNCSPYDMERQADFHWWMVQARKLGEVPK